MPKQPNMEDLGGTPGVTDARPADTDDGDAYVQGEPKIADAGEPFGASVARRGQSEADLASRRDRRQFIAARTQAITGLIGLRAQYATDPDYTTVQQRWIDDAAKTVDDAAGLISSEPVRLTYYDSLHEPLMQERRNFARQAFQGAADAHAAHREQLLQQLEQNLSTDPDHALSNAGWNIIHSNIDDAVDKRFITPEQAAIEQKAAALRLTAATYKKLAQEDPARTIEELTGEQSPHPLVPFLPAGIKDSLVSQAQLYIRAGQLAAKRNAVLADQKNQQATAQSTAHYVKLAVAGEPDLALRIANDAALTPEDKNGLLDITDRTTKPEPRPTASKANALKILDRIRRDDGDAERLTDRTEIDAAYARGELSKDHYQFIVQQFDAARTPEGARLAAQMRAFMFHFKPLVDPHSPNADAIGTEQTFQVEQALAASIARMRADGKDPGDLFDPSKPDYIGSPLELVPELLPHGGLQVPPTPSAPPYDTPPDEDLKAGGTITPPPDASSAPRQDEQTSAPDGTSSANSPRPGNAELRSYQPSLSDAFKYRLHDLFTSAGMKRLDAAHFADAVTGLLGFSPFSRLFTADDFKTAVERRDVPGALWAAASLILGAKLPKLKPGVRQPLGPSKLEPPSVPKTEGPSPVAPAGLAKQDAAPGLARPSSAPAIQSNGLAPATTQTPEGAPQHDLALTYMPGGLRAKSPRQKLR